MTSLQKPPGVVGRGEQSFTSIALEFVYEIDGTYRKRENGETLNDQNTCPTKDSLS